MGTSLQELGRSIKRLQTRHHREMDALLGEIGTTLVQWDALRAVGRNPDASSHDLAELTFQTDQAFGTLATRLIDKGLITRAAGKGRALRHRLTPKGQEILKKGTAVAEKMLSKSFAPLNEAERAQLLGLVLRLLPEKEPGDQTPL
ncbi:MAG TPA: MarR family transcriptional regulator [Magnetospirillaceae bacterium]|jgi:DNA-binding MarR family transcriptional regulator